MLSVDDVSSLVDAVVESDEDVVLDVDVEPDAVLDAVVLVSVVDVPSVVKPNSASVFSSAAINGLVLESPVDCVPVESVDPAQDEPLPD